MSHPPPQNRVNGDNALKLNLVICVELMVTPTFFPFPLLLGMLPLMVIVNWTLCLPCFTEGVVLEGLRVGSDRW